MLNMSTKVELIYSSDSQKEDEGEKDQIPDKCFKLANGIDGAWKRCPLLCLPSSLAEEARISTERLNESDIPPTMPA